VVMTQAPLVKTLRSVVGLAAMATLALAAAGCGGSEKARPMTQQEMIAADPLPLAKGARWTYQVSVKKYDPEADKDVTSQMSWTTEVLDEVESNGLISYRIKGWPSDLADFDNAPVATERTLLRAGNNFLWAASNEAGLDGAEGWFSWPLLDGQKICPNRELVYCWQVSGVETGYELTFSTGPDEQIYQLQPGTGVARYVYAHHGTTNTVEAKLVEYQKGERRK
jgi:hypothetical protein